MNRSYQQFLLAGATVLSMLHTNLVSATSSMPEHAPEAITTTSSQATGKTASQAKKAEKMKAQQAKKDKAKAHQEHVAKVKAMHQEKLARHHDHHSKVKVAPGGHTAPQGMGAGHHPDTHPGLHKYINKHKGGKKISPTERKRIKAIMAEKTKHNKPVTPEEAKLLKIVFTGDVEHQHKKALNGKRNHLKATTSARLARAKT